MVSSLENQAFDTQILKFYHDNLFQEIDRIPDEGTPMVQMIKKFTV